MHLIVLSTQPQPQMLSLRLTDLPPATRGANITANALFDENYALPLRVSADGTATFQDMLGSYYTKIYRVGCAPPAPSPGNLVVDPSFEGTGNTAPGWAPQNGMAQAWRVACAHASNVSGYYPLCDPRLHIRSSTAAPHGGRHCARVQIPTRTTTAMLTFPMRTPPVQGATATGAGAGARAEVAYRVGIWARSSPAAVNATLRVLAAGMVRGSVSVPLRAGRWTEVTTVATVANASVPLVVQLLLAPTVGVAATVWLDDASARPLPNP